MERAVRRQLSVCQRAQRDPRERASPAVPIWRRSDDYWTSHRRDCCVCRSASGESGNQSRRGNSDRARPGVEQYRRAIANGQNTRMSVAHLTLRGSQRIVKMQFPTPRVLRAQGDARSTRYRPVRAQATWPWRNARRNQWISTLPFAPDSPSRLGEWQTPPPRWGGRKASSRLKSRRSGRSILRRPSRRLDDVARGRD